VWMYCRDFLGPLILCSLLIPRLAMARFSLRRLRLHQKNRTLRWRCLRSNPQTSQQHRQVEARVLEMIGVWDGSGRLVCLKPLLLMYCGAVPFRAANVRNVGSFPCFRNGHLHRTLQSPNCKLKTRSCEKRLQRSLPLLRRTCRLPALH
jgi:hypothetical protein